MLLRKLAYLSWAGFAACIAFGAAISAEETPLNVTIGPSRPLPPDFVGFNGNLSGINVPWDNARLVETFKASHARTLRYPGGTVGNYWDWESGGVDRSLSKKDFGLTQWVARFQRPGISYPLENLSKLTQAANAKPVFMLNMVHDSLEGQIAHLRRAEALGMPVEYIELGNEFYLGGAVHPTISRKYPTPEAYGEACNQWIVAIKRAFPNTKVAVIGAAPGNPAQPHSDRRSRWNEGVLKTIVNADALTIHLYAGAGLGNRANQHDNQEPGERERQSVLLQTPEGVARVLEQPYVLWRRLVAENGLPDAFDTFWITEFNLWDTAGAVQGTWAHGLAIANFMNLFLNEPRITLVNYHNFLASPMFTAVQADRNALEHGEATTQAGVARPYPFSAAGRVMALFGVAMSGMTHVAPIQLERTTVDPPKQGTSPFPEYFGWQFANENQQIYLIANQSKHIKIVVCPYFYSETATFEQFVAEPAIVIDSESRLKHRSGSVTGNVELSPYSITLIR